MIKEIKYNGFTATPSDYECPDGDLTAAINLVPEDDGILKPIAGGTEIAQLPSGEQEDSISVTYRYRFRLLFVHKNTSYKHLILVKEKYYEGETDYYCQLFWLNCNNEADLSDAIADAFAVSDTFAATPISGAYTCREAGSLAVSAIGNTLIVTGGKDGEMHYVLWKNNSYQYLGSHLPEIYLSFSLKGYVDYKAPQGGYAFDNSTLNLQDPDRVGSSYFHQIISYAARKISDSIMGFVAQKTKEIKDSGYFVHPFFVRYALRLYDGSLAMHSAPILMNPCTTCNPFVYASSATEEYVNIVAMFVKAELECKFLNNISDTDFLSNWEDIITGIDIFVSNQMFPYNQDGNIEGIETTAEGASATSSNTGRGGALPGLASNRSTLVRDSVFVGTVGYGEDGGNHYAQYRFTHLCGWYPRARDGRDANATYAQDSWDGRDIVSGSWPKYAFSMPELEEGQAKRNVESASTFYFLYSIPLGEISSYTTRKKVEFPVTRLDTSWDTGARQEEAYTSALTSILGAEQMTDDYRTHDKISPSSIFDYNGRLNLAGVKRTLFNGFPLSSMLAYCNTRYNYYVTESNPHGAFDHIRSYDRYDVVVYLKIDGVEKEVVCILGRAGQNSLQNFLSDQNNNGEYRGESWGCYFFYPNADAYKMRIIHRGAGDPGGSYSTLFHEQREYYDIMLKKHDFLNGAYAFLDYNTVRLKTGDESSDRSVDKVVVNELGKIYTSEASNPFVYSTTNINTIGTGNILGLSTAAKALSQGQFGQFPLYAFTTEGVWALEVSSSGAYSAKQPITRDVCSNPQSITQLDNSVLFATARGIMLLSGSDSICISDSITSKEHFSLSDLPRLSNLSNEMITVAGDIVPFLEFLPGARMLYDYTHQRIIVYNPEKDYAYVYSLKSKQWGMMQSDIKYSINSYPDCLAVDGDNNIINLSSVPEVSTSQEEETESETENEETAEEEEEVGDVGTDDDAQQDGVFTANALLVTRPIKLDAPDFLKTVDTIIQRGYFRKGHIKTILYGSRDLFNWHLVYSSTDHILRGFRGTPYKYFRIVLLCSLSEDESIFGCTVQFTPRLLDQPR